VDADRVDAGTRVAAQPELGDDDEAEVRTGVGNSEVVELPEVRRVACHRDVQVVRALVLRAHARGAGAQMVLRVRCGYGRACRDRTRSSAP